MKTEATLLSEIAAAPTLREQAALVAELDALRNSKTARVQADRDWDAAGAVVEQTLSPVFAHSLHTASTDWLSDAEIPQVDANHVHANASIWFGKTSSMVKADEEEFSEQARGVARRIASAYGEQAPEAERLFMDYVAFLRRREGASGLDQIQQTVDPNNQPKTTPLPTDVFDTFQDPIDPMNQGVDEAQSSDGAPLLNEILQEGNGSGQPEVPNSHGAGPYTGPRTNGSGMSVGASLVDAPSPGIGYLYNLDDFLRAESALQAQAGRQPSDDQEDHTSSTDLTATASGSTWCDDCGARMDSKGLCPSCTPDSERNEDERSGEDVRGRKRESSKKEAASGLDQVEQVIDPNNQPKRTSLPTDVAFPLIPYFAGPGQTLDEAYSDRKEGSHRKTADEFTPPAQNVGGDNPMLNKTHVGGEQSATEPTNAMEKATKSAAVGEGNYAQCPKHKDQSYNKSTGACSCGDRHSPLDKKASLSKQAAAEYNKGARFASTWQPGQAIVRQGSVEFEAGLYAGITANAAAQEAWLAEHERWAPQDKGIADRIAMHAAFSEMLRAEAATTTDLDSMTPGTSPSPSGDTPLNGPGTAPPMAGGMDPAAPGGASPYNGAEPFSKPVAPDPGWQPPRTASVDNDRLRAFQQRVQAGLTAQAGEAKVPVCRGCGEAFESRKVAEGAHGKQGCGTETGERGYEMKRESEAW